MPTYDYLCRECGRSLNIFNQCLALHLKLVQIAKLKNCNVERIISGGTGLIFKGSGFYLTDYKNKKGNSKKSKSGNSETKTKQKKKTIVKKEKNLHELVTNYKDGKRCFTCSG